MSIPAPLLDRIRRARILAVVTLDSPDQAEPLADALLAGGITALELTLRTEAGVESIRRIKRTHPDLLVSAGTVLTGDQVRAVRDAGADLSVAPGLNATTIQAAAEIGLPFAPGVCTPSDVEAALAQGCRLLKFFPCEPCGGLPYLNAIAAPYRHLGVSFLPLGGIGPESAARYLAEPFVTAIGGSWIAPAADITNGQWAAIRDRARAATGVS